MSRLVVKKKGEWEWKKWWVVWTHVSIVRGPLRRNARTCSTGCHDESFWKCCEWCLDSSLFFSVLPFGFSSPLVVITDNKVPFETNNRKKTIFYYRIKSIKESCYPERPLFWPILEGLPIPQHHSPPPSVWHLLWSYRNLLVSQECLLVRLVVQ